MIQVRTNFWICEKLEDLPNLNFSDEIFLDVETKRVFDDPKLGGLYPWKGDKICGFGISADNIKNIWYIPIRHTCPAANNMPIELIMKWLQEILKTSKSWINHFVKFDAMMLAVGDGLEINLELICTIVLCKLLNSDMMVYGLKYICKEWLNYDYGSLDRVKAYLESIKSKSYADVPIDLMGEYCCDDVQMNRLLYRHLQEKLPTELNRVRGTEKHLTSVLFDMEKRGMCIDETECKKESVKSLRIMIDRTTKIVELTEREFTNSNTCIYDILINQLDLPVLSTIIERTEEGDWIDTGRPSFNKDAMLLYKVHPMVTNNGLINNIVQNILEYRVESTFTSLYLDNFLALNVDGIIHPNYNQVVRTGRMSCSKPSSQQQNYRSKKLIHPHKGFGFISNDYSQIEYRLIVHYIKDEEAIKAYNEDPNTDFHLWVANLLQNIDRDSGKTLNFGMAYGAGKKKVTSGLMANETIIARINPKISEMVAQGILDPKLQDKKFKELCTEFANEAYQAYHDRLPGIKATARLAMQNAKLRGFVFNAYGRRRHLSLEFARKAFNTIIQGCAADIMKERMVALSPRFNSESKAWNLFISANVHDENLDEAPLEVLWNKKLHNFVCDTLQNPSVKFRVPIITGLGISPNNWAEAAGKKTIEVDGKQIGKLR